MCEYITGILVQELEHQKTHYIFKETCINSDIFKNIICLYYK